MTVTNMRILIRRDTATAWELNGDNVLLTGEIGYETDARRMKVGNGVTGYRDLPYLAGGMVSVHPDGGLALDGTGALYFDNDAVLGPIPSDQNIKEYVDALVQAEGSIRNQEILILSNRIDANVTNISNEIANRQNADSALQQQIGTLQNRVIAEEETRAQQDSLLLSQINVVKSDLTSLELQHVTELQEERTARIDGDIALQQQISQNLASLGDVSTDLQNERIERQNADAAILVRLTDVEQDLDNVVTDLNEIKDGYDFTGPISAPSFKGDIHDATDTFVIVDHTAKEVHALLFTGKLEGVSKGQHFGPVFKQDTEGSPVVVLNPGLAAGDIATYEGDLYKQGGLVKMVDSDAGEFNGKLNGNTEGVHTGSVDNANGTVVDVTPGSIVLGQETDPAVVHGSLMGDVTGDLYGDVYDAAVTPQIFIDHTAREVDGVVVSALAADVATNTADIATKADKDVTAGTYVTGGTDVTSVDAAITELDGALDTAYDQIALKAAAADVYTSAQVDTALADKADAADVYTIAQVDTALAGKVTKAVLTTLATDGLAAEGAYTQATIQAIMDKLDAVIAALNA